MKLEKTSINDAVLKITDFLFTQGIDVVRTCVNHDANKILICIREKDYTRKRMRDVYQRAIEIEQEYHEPPVFISFLRATYNLNIELLEADGYTAYKM